MAGLGEPQRNELPPDRDIGKSTRGRDGEMPDRIGRSRDTELERRLLRLSTAICSGVSSNALGTRRGEWSRGYRAYNNQHLETSKYRTNTYRTRAKNYVPKTRQAVKKNMVAGASALFGASDVIAVTAENDADPNQQASALINQELLNYRLDRTNFKAGISWFPICMMQLQTSRITGVCFSKQYWEYEEILVPAGPEDLMPPEPPPQEMAAPSPDAGAPAGGMSPPGMPPGFPPPDQMGGAVPSGPMDGTMPDMGGGMPASMPPMPGGDMGGMGPPGSTGPSPPGSPPVPTEAFGPGGPMPPMPEAQEPQEAQELQQQSPEEAQEPPPMPEIVVGMDGQPMVPKVLRDRPRVRPFPPEQAIIDLSAPAEDVVQEGEFFIMQMPMRISQIRLMQQKGRQTMGGGPWLDVPEERLKKATEEYTATSVRSSRGRGTDPQSTVNQPSISELDIVWVHENFIKVDGTDFHFYSLSHDTLLSAPGPTDEHYPKHQGERPYVMGLGEIEAFSPIPMSMVESIQPLQNEINDIRNLALDTLKQGIAPIGVYKRGTDIDLRALKERGPDANIGVGNMDDLRFEKVPGPDPISFNMHDRLTIEIDESAGSFSTSSVNNNRAAGETVGGLNLISNAANSTQEYDLRVFTETYVERVLRQLIMLEQGYETDEHILAIVGQKANVFQRFGVDKSVDELLQAQVTTRVNCGIGATDPMMKLQKFGSALQMAATVAEFVPGQVQVKAEDVYNEIFASAGYKAERFFVFTSPEEVAQQQAQQPDPQQMMAEAEAKKAEAEAKRADAEATKAQIEGQRLQLETQQMEADGQEKQARLEMDQQQQQRQTQVEDRQFERDKEVTDREHNFKRDQHEAAQASGERDHQLARDQFDHTQQTAEADHQLARDQFDHSQESGQKDFSLKAAGQNKQLIDEATAQAAEIMQPQQAREPLPVEQAMTDTMTQLQQMMGQLGQSIQTLVDGQQQGQQMLQQMVEGQSHTQQTMQIMLQELQRGQELRRRVRSGMGMEPSPEGEVPPEEPDEDDQ